MDWMAPIDAYCERIEPGLLGEPLNALSNLSFFAAALWAARAARSARADWPIWLLIFIVGLIGLGSVAFHVFAVRWSLLADVIPISLFIYGYLAFALRRLLAMSWTAIGMSLAVLFGATALIERLRTVQVGEPVNGHKRFTHRPNNLMKRTGVLVKDRI